MPSHHRAPGLLLPLSAEPLAHRDVVGGLAVGGLLHFIRSLVVSNGIQYQCQRLSVTFLPRNCLEIPRGLLDLLHLRVGPFEGGLARPSHVLDREAQMESDVLADRILGLYSVKQFTLSLALMSW